jgi:uncharacterized secreted protein with C-terminal beta-propeller domain
MYRKIVSTALLAIIFGSMPFLLLSNLFLTPEVVEGSSLKKFGSYNELFTYLNQSRNSPTYYYGPRIFGGTMTRTFSALESDAAKQTADYSTTNIQVEGVDEADIIKTDGTYIYMVTGTNISIILAYPPEEARLVANLEINSTIMGIFINEDKLVVFSQQYPYWRIYPETTYTSIQAQVKIYNISDKENINLEHEISLDGYIYNSPQQTS